ncbi:hypothetical protein [Lelliottia amnigena]|uniref:hypothetical protein n=1 Tax=Lelliottia amnigena TaxID=61646 RepID=UPI001C24EF93|nr:hypothetical protein [Lelliottia amnigena]QXB19822.1 hypothetical protein I6L76_11145 [Lelliottia amnigena]
MTITREFTKEQLSEWADKLIEETHSDISISRTDAHAESYRAQLALLEIALASLEAEPVSEFYHEARWGWYEISEGDSVPERARIPLYRVPPAPVSVPAITKHFDEIALETAREIMCDVNRRHEFLGGEVQLLFRIQCRVDDACRAAMLPANHSVDANEKDKAEPVSNRDELPVTQFKPVADLYGITSPTGSETIFTFDAVEARDFIDGGWSCQEYVELERYQAAMTNQSEQVLDMVNSPVIQDGWVMVPVEPTAEMIWAAKYVMTSTVGWDSFKEAYKSMIAAAPQQESVSSALEHGMASYSGAMQKLADGGD